MDKLLGQQVRDRNRSVVQKKNQANRFSVVLSKTKTEKPLQEISEEQDQLESASNGTSKEPLLDYSSQDAVIIAMSE